MRVGVCADEDDGAYADAVAFALPVSNTGGAKCYIFLSGPSQYITEDNSSSSKSARSPQQFPVPFRSSSHIVF